MHRRNLWLLPGMMTPCGSPGVGCSEGSGARLRKGASCGTVLDLTAFKKDMDGEIKELTKQLKALPHS